MTQAFKDFNPKTVIIGNQVWMAENLSITDGGEGIYYNEKNRQYYYTWDAAMRVTKAIPGWHLPSAVEWDAAIVACGANVMDNKWKDSPYMHSFIGVGALYDMLNVLPAGCLYDDRLESRSSALFWTATDCKQRQEDAYVKRFEIYGTLYTFRKWVKHELTIRLVKDIQSEEYN